MQDKPPQHGLAQDDEPDRPHADLKDVDDRLRRARAKGGKDRQMDDQGPSKRSAAYRLGTEIVAGLLAGALLGWFLDRVLNTAPWLLLVCMLLGFAAGVTNAVRQLQRWNQDD